MADPFGVIAMGLPTPLIGLPSPPAAIRIETTTPSAA